MADYDKETYKMVKRLEEKSLTNTKPYVITGTSTIEDLNGYAIYAIEVSVIAAGSVFGNAGDTLVGETILAGHVWYVPVVDLQLTSGAVIVYRHEN